MKIFISKNQLFAEITLYILATWNHYISSGVCFQFGPTTSWNKTWMNEIAKSVIQETMTPNSKIWLTSHISSTWKAIKRNFAGTFLIFSSVGQTKHYSPYFVPHETFSVNRSLDKVIEHLSLHMRYFQKMNIMTVWLLSISHMFVCPTEIFVF